MCYLILYCCRPQDRMAMFQSSASEAAASRIPPPPAAAAAAPTEDIRGSAAEASMLSRIPGPPSSSAGLQRDLEAESSHDTFGVRDFLFCVPLWPLLGSLVLADSLRLIV